MKKITLDDIQRYVDLLPEAARERYIKENRDAILWLYEREKEESDAQDDGNGGQTVR